MSIDFITGIDSDLGGGIATVDFSGEKPVLVNVDRVPVREVQKNRKTVRQLDGQELAAILKGHENWSYYVAVESALTKPQIGAKGLTMTRGIDVAHQTFGGLRALSEALWGAPSVYVAWPSSWKKEMGLTSDKEKSLAMVMELHESDGSLWKKKKNAGLAEAVLLAHWLRKKLHSSALAVDKRKSGR